MRKGKTVFAGLFLSMSLRALAIDVGPEPHPNHYVLLIDSSGSIARPVRAAVFQQALTSTIDRLYGDGFNVIPPYDLEHDSLTIEHFGCVTGDPETAADRLKFVDYLRDFIHPVIARQKNVTAEHARQLAMPVTHYALTLLTFSRSVGILATRPQTPDDAAANRTFLIRVTDLEVNDSTLSEEQSLIQSKSEHARLDAVKAAIRILDESYAVDGSLSITTFGQDANTVTVEVWEVRSRAISEWSAHAASVSSFATGVVAWQNRDGDTVPGMLTIHATDDAQKWLMGEGSTSSVSGQPFDAEHFPVIPVAVTACAPVPVEIHLAASRRFVDPLLGTVRIGSTVVQQVPLPVPSVCGLPYYILKVVLALVGGLALLAATYYYLFTRVWTRITVRRPAGLQSWRLRWTKPTLFDDVVLPRETEALRVELPTGMHRALLYRNAKLVIISEPGDEFQWNDTGQQTIPINSAGERADVRRRAGKTQASGFRIEVQNNDRAAVFVRAPQGKVPS